MKSPSRHKLILSVLVVTVVLAGYGGLAYTNSLWPFIGSAPKSETQHIEDEEKEDSNNSEIDTKTEQEPSQETPPPQENNGFINDPIDSPPQNAAYPIETPHYRIDQTSSTAFTVTLYPIVSSSGQSEYEAQLKQYKREAIDYLNSRYGDPSKYTVTWRPADAEKY